MGDRPLEYCTECSSATGRAGRGEDSIYYLDNLGPFCEDCHDQLGAEVVDNLGLDDLRTQLAEALAKSNRALMFLRGTMCFHTGCPIEEVAESVSKEWHRRGYAEQQQRQRLADLQREVEDWKAGGRKWCEAYGEAGVDIDKLRADNERQAEALHDIAGGHTSQYVDAPDLMTAESPAAFQHDMWVWSQRIARAALAQPESPQPDEAEEKKA